MTQLAGYSRGWERTANSDSTTCVSANKTYNPETVPGSDLTAGLEQTVGHRISKGVVRNGFAPVSVYLGQICGLCKRRGGHSSGRRFFGRLEKASGERLISFPNMCLGTFWLEMFGANQVYEFGHLILKELLQNTVNL